MNYGFLGLAVWLFCGLFGWIILAKLLPFERGGGFLITTLQFLFAILTLTISLIAGPITIIASWLTKDEMTYGE